MHDLDNPYPFLAQLRSHDPVHRLGDSDFYLVTSWEMVAEAVGRPGDFSSNLTATMVWGPDGSISGFPIAEPGSPLHVLATADDPVHRSHRAMVMPSLVPKSISRLEPFISETLRTLWDEGLRDGRIDWVRTVAQRTPMRVIAELIGFPAYDVDDLVRWSFAATVLLDGVVTSEQLGSATQAIGELSDYLDRAFATACEAPADHVMGDLARMVNSGTIERGTAVLILLQLVAAGAESTVSLIGSAAWLLGTEPDLQNRLRADSGLVPTFIEEAVRLESPFRGHYRHVVADTTLGDVALPAGSHLYLSWAAANRDPSRHDAPDTVTLDATGRRPHLAFGKGIHLCVGAALARLEGRLAIDWLLNVTDHFTVDGGDAEWERSLLVRRLRSLPLTVTA